MKAVVFHGVGDIRVDNVPEPRLESDKDAIIRIKASSICGTDLHMVRGSMPGMKKGTILGHEAVGIVEQVGKAVKTVSPGDRVVVCSSIACGECVYCKAGEFSSCDEANPVGPEAGTAFFGGPMPTGSYNGLQAEKARIPYADTVLVKLPEEISDEDGLLLSDVFPTGYMAAEIADTQPGDFIAVFGCGPVGQMAIASAKLLGASAVIAVDCLPDRLKMAQEQGAIAINYETQDPVSELKNLTNGFGPDGVIDAVGADAQCPHGGPAKKNPVIGTIERIIEQKMIAPRTVLFGNQWRPGNSPFQALRWAVLSVRKSGVISIVGLYPQSSLIFPVGLAMQKKLTVRAANCSHRKYIPLLIDLMKESGFRPSHFITRTQGLKEAIFCYKNFDKHTPGWMKVEMVAPRDRAA